MTFIRNLKKRALTLDKAIISDILLWLLLALMLAYVIKLFAIDIPEHRGQRITLPFKDASAIIVGSPVRMMGLEIGYVSNLQVKADHVDITVQTNPDALPIPTGTTFTILFTGLGGSESIEAALPENVTSGDLKPRQAVYLVHEPIRLNQVLKTSTDVTYALQQGAENITDFFGKKKPINVLQLNILQVHDWSKASINVASKVESGMSKAQQIVSKSAKTQMSTLDIINRQLAQATQITRNGSGRVAKMLDKLGESHKKASSLSDALTRKKLNLENNLNKLNHSLTASDSSFQNMLHWGQWGSDTVARWSTPPVQAPSVVVTTISPKKSKVQLAKPIPSQNLPGYLASASSWLNDHPLSPILDNARKGLQAFNQQVLGWQKQVEEYRNKKATSKSK